jgi:hypothetical protein
MGLGSELEHADRFAAYVNELTKVLGHVHHGENACNEKIIIIVKV